MTVYLVGAGPGGSSAAHHLDRLGPASAVTQAFQKVLDRAHARYLTASKALATAQKLLRPSLSPLDLVSRPVAERKAKV